MLMDLSLAEKNIELGIGCYPKLIATVDASQMPMGISKEKEKSCCSHRIYSLGDTDSFPAATLRSVQKPHWTKAASSG